MVMVIFRTNTETNLGGREYYDNLIIKIKRADNKVSSFYFKAFNNA